MMANLSDHLPVRQNAPVLDLEIAVLFDGDQSEAVIPVTVRLIIGRQIAQAAGGPRCQKLALNVALRMLRSPVKMGTQGP